MKGALPPLTTPLTLGLIAPLLHAACPLEARATPHLANYEECSWSPGGLEGGCDWAWATPERIGAFLMPEISVGASHGAGAGEPAARLDVSLRASLLQLDATLSALLGNLIGLRLSGDAALSGGAVGLGFTPLLQVGLGRLRLPSLASMIMPSARYDPEEGLRLIIDTLHAEVDYLISPRLGVGIRGDLGLWAPDRRLGGVVTYRL